MLIIPDYRLCCRDWDVVAAILIAPLSIYINSLSLRILLINSSDSQSLEFSIHYLDHKLRDAVFGRFVSFSIKLVALAACESLMLLLEFTIF